MRLTIKNFLLVVLFTIFVAILLLQVMYKSLYLEEYWALNQFNSNNQSELFTMDMNEILKEPAYEYNPNNSHLLPPSARITARKIFHHKPLVIWSSEWHMTPIKDLKFLLEPFGVVVLDFNLDPGRCAWHNCGSAKKLKVLHSNNVLDVPDPVPKKFYETYWNSSEMKKVDAFFCGYPASLCQIYLPFNKSVIVHASTRYDVGRYTVERWNALNEALIEFSKKPWNVIGGNNLYDAQYIKYYTGIDTRHIESMCDYTGVEYNTDTNVYWVLRRRDRGFNDIFYKEFKKECTKINCSVNLIHMPYPHDQKTIPSIRGVVHVPYQISVMSIFEHYRMNIPQIFPTKDLLAKWQVEHYIMYERSFNGAWMNQKPKESIIRPHPSQSHVPDPKNEHDFNATRYWMEFADFYQIMPHSIYYNSIPELVNILQTLTIEDLWKISLKMRQHNIETKKKLLGIWREILLKIAKHSSNNPH